MEKVSNVDYHYQKRISRSLIVKVRDDGVIPAWRSSPWNPECNKSETDALVFGNLYHSLINNPDVVSDFENAEILWENEKARFAADKNTKDKPVIQIQLAESVVYIADFGLTRKNKEYEKIKARFTMGGDDIVVLWDEYKLAVEMVRALFTHPVYQAYSQMEKIVDEFSIYFDNKSVMYDEVSCMLRADRLLKTADGKYIIIEWKSCRETSLRAQSYVGIKKGYDIFYSFLFYIFIIYI